jgi:RNA polymerase sigma-70 factor (ECF subfamily)
MVKLEEIVEGHAAMVRRIATVYERHPDRVDDLVQDVWIAVWQALPRLNNQATLKSYIARITQNICVTHVRRALVRQAQPLNDTLPDPAPAPDEATVHAMRLARLVEAVRNLPDNLKAAILQASFTEPVANRTKAQHATFDTGFAAPQPAASAAQPDRICDTVRHFPAPYLRGGHGTDHDAWDAQSDLDSWPGTRRSLAPGRSM